MPRGHHPSARSGPGQDRDSTRHRVRAAEFAPPVAAIPASALEPASFALWLPYFALAPAQFPGLNNTSAAAARRCDERSMGLLLRQGQQRPFTHSAPLFFELRPLLFE